MSAGIYRIGHNDSDRGYIGQTIDFDVRFGLHWGQLRRNVHHNKPLQHAYNKYGADAFTIIVVETCDIYELDEDASKQLLWDREIVWWEKEPNPYNTAPPGPSMLGYKHTDEARANMSAAFMGRNKGVPLSDETKAKQSAALTGRKLSEETKRKISESHMGMSSPMKGIPRTEEVREKIRETNTGHEVTQEARDKISASLRQYHQDVRDGKIEPKPRKQRGPNSDEQNAAIGNALRGRKRPQHVIDAMWAGRDRYIAEQKAIKEAAAQASLEGMSATDSRSNEAT